MDTAAVKLRAFQSILALVVASEYWTMLLLAGEWLDALDVAGAGIATLVAVAVLQGRYRRHALLVLALLQAAWIWRFFPAAGNHRYLELALATLFLLAGDESVVERRLALRSARVVVAVVLFYSGLQKLAWGYWFRGEFLAWSLWRDSFRAALGPLLAPEELARLLSYTGQAGDGPYRIAGPLGWLASNCVWILELSLPGLLLVRRTRTAAWIVGAVFLIAVELVAREIHFGIEFVALLTLYSRGEWPQPLVRPVMILLGLLLALRVALPGAVPFH